MNANEIYINTVLPQLSKLVDQALQRADDEYHEFAQFAEEDNEQNQHYEVLQQLRIQRHSIIFHFQEYWLQKKPYSTPSEQVSNLAKLLKHFEITDSNNKLSNGQTDKLAAQTILQSFLYALTHAGLKLHSNVQIMHTFEALLNEQLNLIQRTGYQALETLGITIASTQHVEPKNKVQPISKLYLALEKLKKHYLSDLTPVLQRSINASEPIALGLFNYQQELSDKKLYSGPISEAEQKALNAIAHLFNLIISKPELDDKAKQVILWLQLPYTCIALNDQQFLLNAQHLAHYILDELIHLAQQWQNYDQTAQLPALQQKLVQTVLSIWRHPLNNNAVMQQILYDILLYNDGLKQQQAASSKQEEGQHKAKKTQEIIHQQIDEACYQALSAATGPILSSELINQGWKPLMYLLASKYGLDSEPWCKAVTVLEDLGNSLRPAEEYNSRTEYLLLLPPLLKKLTLGLKAVQSPMLIAQYLHTLSIEHTAIAQQIEPLDIDDEHIEQARQEVKLLEWQLFQHEQQAGTAHDTPPNFQSDEPKKEQENKDQVSFNTYTKQEEVLKQLGAGSELNWLVKGKSQRLRIAAYIKHTEQYILIYPNGSKALELSRTEMLEKLRAGELESLGSGGFFNDALASVIHSMRQQ